MTPVVVTPGTAVEIAFTVTSRGRVFVVRTFPMGDVSGRLVVCAPFGAEAARNYQREVHLGRRLAADGFETIRFHYRGAGQSDPSPDGGIDAMIEDAATTVDGLAPLPTFWLGTRLGGVVAAAVSPPSDALMIWDPVIDVEGYFREILRARVFSAFKHAKPDAAPRSDLVTDLVRLRRIDLLGYEVNALLYEQTRRLGTQPLSAPDRKIALIDLNRRGEPREETLGLASTLEAAGCRVRTESVEFREPWWYGARAGSAASTNDPTARLLDLSRQVILEWAEPTR